MRTPHQVGRVRLDAPIGRGGTATVYRGTHLDTGRTVAVKLVSPDDLRSLRSESLAGRVLHPHIAALLDWGNDDTTGWLVSEWVDGGTLAAHRLTNWTETRRLARQVLSALAYAHARTLIHGDLKPENLLWDTQNARWKLIDFGIARVPGQPHDVGAAGTPLYVAPEQIRNDDGLIRPWTDLYALGIVLWQVCTGAPPFVGSVRAVLRAHLEAEPGDFEPRFAVPTGFEALLRGLLAKAPYDRPEYAADVLRTLAALEPPEALPSPLRWTLQACPAERSARVATKQDLPLLPSDMAPLLEALATAPVDAPTLVALEGPSRLVRNASMELVVRVAEAGGALCLALTDEFDVAGYFRVGVGATDDRAASLERIHAWAEISDALAERIWNVVRPGGALDADALAAYLAAVAVRRGLVVVVWGTNADPDRLALVRACRDHVGPSGALFVAYEATGVAPLEGVPSIRLDSLPREAAIARLTHASPMDTAAATAWIDRHGTLEAAWDAWAEAHGVLLNTIGPPTLPED